ncbi:MAG TPA: LPXTG cell wall anchor domain-containing protein [Anaerolineales bacterium]|nr:LPXTG cell wall anchor domain-containing protein [Anaerolineales bacterium]
MSQHDTNQDNHLADFADQVLQGKINTSASSSDADMVRLEETILRLKNTLPSTNAPDTAKTKQMLVRLKARMKREEETEKIPFWKKLFDFQSNPQVGMLVIIAAVLILAVITVPSLEFGGGNNPTTGTANNNANFLIGGGIVGLLLLVYWIFRRK